MIRWTEQIPNALTICRLALTPWLFLAIAHREFPLALKLCIAAGVSDALDGFLARRFSWTTQLGAYLDPVADKLMLSAVYLALALAKLTPLSYVVILFGRDLLILLGTAFLYVATPIRSFPPTIWGKASTAALILVALGIIATAACCGLSAPTIEKIARISVGTALVLTVLSGIHYLLRGFWALRAVMSGTPVERLD